MIGFLSLETLLSAAASVRTGYQLMVPAVTTIARKDRPDGRGIASSQIEARAKVIGKRRPKRGWA